MQFYRYANYGDEIILETYNLHRETPKGYWITQQYWIKNKWINKTSTKRFAYPTKEEALESFKKRKYRQRIILNSQLLVLNSINSKLKNFVI
jgi:hypothetical protein